MQYRPEIDGLRAIAVIPVILFHAGFETFSGGFVGVDVFFVISGYLITSIIVSELDAGTFTLRRFYERRARRILPALFFVIACCIPVAWFTLTPNYMKDFAQSVFAAATFSSNILFWRESGYFATAAELKPLLHTWSLAVEEQYYILFPLFMIVAWRYFRVLVPAFLALVFVLSFALSQYAAYNHPAANFYLLPTRGWELLIGVFIALYIDRIRLSQRVSSAVSTLGIVLILISIVTFNEATPFPSAYALVPTLGTACVIIGTRPKSLLTNVLSSTVAVTIGMLSYSLYLWHQPILAFIRHSKTHILTNYDITFALIATFLLSAATYKLVETPLRRKTFKSVYITTIGSIAAALCIFGIVGHMTSGYAEARYPAELVTALEEAKERNPLRTQCGASSNNWSNPADSCVLGAESLTGDAHVALVGDSHTDAIAYTLHEELLSSSNKVRHMWYSGCPPVEGLYRVDAATFNRCAEYMRRAFELIKERDNISTVILHSRWPLYFLGDKFNNTIGGVERGDRAQAAPVRWRNQSYEEDERKDAVLQAYRNSAIDLLENRKNVVVVHAVPEHGWNVPQRAYKSARSNGTLTDLTIPLSVYNERNGEVMAGFESIDHPNLTHIYPSDLYCDEEESVCFSVRDGDILYRDDDHLNNKGAEDLVRRLMSVL